MVTESLSYDSLHNLQKDIVQQEHKVSSTWLLQAWDLMSPGVQLDSGKARNLGSLTQDVSVDQMQGLIIYL